jgi:phytoene desaturase
VLFEDQPKITITSDIATTAQNFEAIEKGAGLKLVKYLGEAETVYNQAMKHFLYSNFSSPRRFLHSDILRSTPRLLRALQQPLDDYVSRYFNDPRLKQILEYPMVFLGTSPFEAPSMYRLMSHMDFKQGVFYPQGGMYSLVNALVTIGHKNNVQYRYHSPVRRIRTLKGKAIGVELDDGQLIDSDIVISNADLHYSETSLLEPEEQTYPATYWGKKQSGPSAILLYLGISGKLPSLQHHNLLFTKDWQGNFHAIYNQREWSHPASMYVCMPSHTDASTAPKNNENLFILIPGPAQTMSNTASIKQHAEQYLDQFIIGSGISDLRQRIVYKKIYGPDDFTQDFHAWQGGALGLSHTLKQSAFFRPKNYSRRVKNLYYVGANTVPGIGLPMCLISAEVLYKRLVGNTTAGPLTTPLNVQTEAS